MSEQQLKAFIEKIAADATLQEKLKAVSDPDSVMAIAKEAGFMISTDDLKKAQVEVSDQELEGAAGGDCCVTVASYNTEGNWCFFSA